MSKYRTYVMDSSAFTVNPSLSSVQIVTDADLDKMEYKISCKMGPETPLEEILRWLVAGASLTATLPGGKKHKLVLLPVED